MRNLHRGRSAGPWINKSAIPAAVAATLVALTLPFGLMSAAAQADPAAPAAAAAIPAAGSITAASPDGSRYAVALPGGENRVEIRAWSGSAAQTVRTEAIPAAVTAIAFSGDGSALAVGSDDRTIRVWDTRTGRRMAELKLPREPKERKESHIAALAFSPAGDALAASDAGYGWLVAYTGNSPSGLSYNNAVLTGDSLLSLAADPRGGWVGGDGSGRFHFYDGATLRQIGQTPSLIAGAIRSLSVSPDDRYLASGGDDNQIKLWHFGGVATAAANGGATFILADRYPASASVRDVVFRSDGSVVLAIDRSGQFQNWAYNSGTGQVAANLPPANTAPAPAVAPPPAPAPTPAPVVPPAPEPTTTASVAPPPPSPAAPPPALGSTSSAAHAAHAAPSNRNVAVASTLSGKRPVPPPHPGVSRPRPTVELERRLVGHSEYVNSVAFSPDGQYLASGSRDKTVRLWRVADGSQVSLLGKHGSYVSAVAFSPDGHLVASAGWDNRIRLWNPQTGAESTDPAMQKHTSYVLSLAFSPDGSRLASGANDLTAREFWLHGTAHAATSKVSAAAGNAVAAVAYSPDGKWIAGGSLDGHVYIYDAATMKTVRSLAARPARPIYCLVWLDNDTVLTSGKAGILRVWHFHSGHAGAAFLADGSDVYGLAVDPALGLVASGGADKLIHFWSLADILSGDPNPKPVAQAKGHTDTVRTLAFSKEGHQLASGGWDYNIVLWRVD